MVSSMGQTDGQTDRRTDARPLARPRSACYAGNVNSGTVCALLVDYARHEKTRYVTWTYTKSRSYMAAFLDFRAANFATIVLSKCSVLSALTLLVGRQEGHSAATTSCLYSCHAWRNNNSVELLCYRRRRSSYLSADWSRYATSFSPSSNHRPSRDTTGLATSPSDIQGGSKR